jgi:hypothetical protein
MEPDLTIELSLGLRTPQDVFEAPQKTRQHD